MCIGDSYKYEITIDKVLDVKALGTIQGINHKYCKNIQKGDGYAYAIATIKQ